jgi:16S rRNA (guanine527-N7)-methyltransferase
MMHSVPTLPVNGQLWLETLGWRPDEHQQEKFQRLYETVLAANQQVNLTRITTPEDFWEKHLWDSLQGVALWLQKHSSMEHSTPHIGPESPVELARAGIRVADIGTGGGFPGLPLAIVFPNWQITLIDATAKKIAAIARIVETLQLSNVHLIADRAEHVGHQPMQRETFDLAVIRAVGSPNACAEYVLPLLKIGGRGVLYRGQWSTEEEEGLQAVLPRLGGQWLGMRSLTTPLSQGSRHNIDILKTASTPDKFPRAPGIPTKTPLQ